MTASPRAPGVTLLFGDLQFQQRYHLLQVGVVFNLRAGVSGSDPRFLEWRPLICSQFAELETEKAGISSQIYFPTSEVTPDCLAFMLSALGASSAKNLQSKSATA